MQPSHGGGGQVGVLMLEFAIESEASLLAVRGEQGGHRVRFGEGGIGSHSLTGRVGEKSSEPAPAWGCSASLQAPVQGQPCPPHAAAEPFPPFVPSSLSPLQPLLFFSPPPLLPPSSFLGGAEAVSGLKNAK